MCKIKKKPVLIAKKAKIEPSHILNISKGIDKKYYFKLLLNYISGKEENLDIYLKESNIKEFAKYISSNIKTVNDLYSIGKEITDLKKSENSKFDELHDIYVLLIIEFILEGNDIENKVKAIEKKQIFDLHPSFCKEGIFISLFKNDIKVSPEDLLKIFKIESKSIVRGIGYIKNIKNNKLDNEEFRKNLIDIISNLNGKIEKYKINSLKETINYFYKDKNLKLPFGTDS